MRKFSAMKISTSRNKLDKLKWNIINIACLGSFWHDAITRKAVLMVGIGSNFYSFRSMTYRKNLFLLIPYNHIKMVLLNAHCTGYWCFKESSIVFMDTLFFNITVAPSNKNNNTMEFSGIPKVSKKFKNNSLRFQQLSK